MNILGFCFVLRSIDFENFSQGLLMINRALDTSKQEAQMARFKAEMADKEIARLKDELEIFSSP